MKTPLHSSFGIPGNRENALRRERAEALSDPIEILIGISDGCD
jgi:hypothetical protein